MSEANKSTARQLCHDDYHRIRSLMHARYPQAFPTRGAPAIPLKIGIVHDMLSLGIPGVSRKRMRRFLHIWTHRIEYQTALANGGTRINLTGEPVGEVTPQQSEIARAALRQIQSRRGMTYLQARMRPEQDAMPAFPRPLSATDAYIPAGDTPASQP